MKNKKILFTAMAVVMLNLIALLGVALYIMYSISPLLGISFTSILVSFGYIIFHELFNYKKPETDEK